MIEITPKPRLQRLLTQKRSQTQFFTLAAIFAVIFIVSYTPVGALSARYSFAPGVEKFYVAALVLTGYLMLLASRLLLGAINRKHELSFANFPLWIIAEIVVISGALSFIAMTLNGETAPLWYDITMRVVTAFLAILVVPYTITILLFIIEEQRQEILSLRKQIALAPPETPSLSEAASEPEVPTDTTLNFFDKGGKLVFATRRSHVLYIEAADNYTNIHYLNGNKEETFILHNSMKNVDQTYSTQGMIRCHRGYLVNVDNVKVLRRERDGLVIELNYGEKLIPVSKTYNESVVRQFAM